MTSISSVVDRWTHREPGEFVLLDNRDSFVFNLAHRMAELGVRPVVVRSDAVEIEELEAWAPAGLVISPGPGHPDGAGISVEAIRYFSGRMPILGICLGHQAIARAFGGTVSANHRPMHGQASEIRHSRDELFDGLPAAFEAARYHSLVVEEPLPEELGVTGRGDGFVMGLRHIEDPTFGIQFHPESVLTPHGYDILGNFLALAGTSSRIG